MSSGGLLCAFVTSRYESLLDAVVVLALFIPVVLALAESVSIQSVTLTLQGFHGGGRDAPRRSLTKELATAALLGVGCGGWSDWSRACGTGNATARRDHHGRHRTVDDHRERARGDPAVDAACDAARPEHRGRADRARDGGPRDTGLFYFNLAGALSDRTRWLHDATNRHRPAVSAAARRVHRRAQRAREAGGADGAAAIRQLSKPPLAAGR